jgi:hypothetical protein
MASILKYRHSRKGHRTTARRVARWREARAHNVTHTAAQKLGPSAIVAPVVAGSPAVEAGVPSGPSEEVTDERHQEGDLARAAQEPDEDVAAGVGEPEADEGEPGPSRCPTGDGEPPADIPTSVDEQARCARCGRSGVEEVGGEEAGDPDNAPWLLRRVRPARRTRSAP